MKVRWTEAALADLDEILAYTSEHYSFVLPALERRIHAVIDRVAKHPESAQQIVNSPGVRAVPLLRYPYRIYYRIVADQIEILHLRHTARQPWEG